MFNRRQAAHWCAGVTAGGLLLFTGLLWTGIKSDYRSEINEGGLVTKGERLACIATLATEWVDVEKSTLQLDLSRFVDRIWAVYYPALALARVPSELPYTGGKFLREGLLHTTTPRLSFPGKAKLESDSEKVREFSGVQVAGEDEDTSIAFGYVIEMYVDLGLPWMFIPILLWGLFLGSAYGWFMRNMRHRDLAVGFTTVCFWLALYLFERSWAKTIGTTLTMMIFLGGVTLVIDRLAPGSPPQKRNPRVPRKNRANGSAAYLENP